MKLNLTCALLFSYCFCFGQRQNVYFFKSNSDPTENKDSADFIRIVREPDAGSEFFQVMEFYMDGKKRFIGQTSQPDPVRLQGDGLSFYNNGRRKATANYKNGVLIKSHYDYYPNGKLYLYKEYTNGVQDKETIPGDFNLVEAYDTSGVATVKNGNGYYIGYNDNFTDTLEQGTIKNGKRNGEWKGKDTLRTTFTEIYDNGVLIKGTAVKDGKTYLYIGARETTPRFGKNHERDFANYLFNHFHYPLRDRENGIQGTVYIKFVVQKDGAVTNIRLLRELSNTINTEALALFKNSPRWLPALKYGMPVAKEYLVPINLALNTEDTTRTLIIK